MATPSRALSLYLMLVGPLFSANAMPRAKFALSLPDINFCNGTRALNLLLLLLLLLIPLRIPQNALQPPGRRLIMATRTQISLVGALLISGLKLDYVLEVAMGLLRQLRAHLRRLLSPNNWNNASSSATSPPTMLLLHLGAPLARGAQVLKSTPTDSSDAIVAAAATGDANSAPPQEPGQADARVAGGLAQVSLEQRRQHFWQSGKSQLAGHESALLLPTGRLVESTLDRMLPEDAHKRCSGRLGLSVTRLSWSSLDNEFVSEFHSRLDLIRAVCAGCFIPLWSGAWLAPKFRGAHYVDGAYSDNEPKFELDSGHSAQDGAKHFTLGQTIVQVNLSPFCCQQVLVSPNDEDSLKLFSWPVLGTIYVCNWRNIVRAWHAMLPSRLSVYKQYLISGHREMKNYLFRNNMLKCRQCFELHQQQQQQNHLNDDYKHNLEQHNTIGDRTQDANACQTNNNNNNNNDSNDSKACLHCLRLFERVDSLRISQQFLHLLDD